MTPTDLAQLTETLLSEAKSAGADACDALAVDSTSLSIEVRNGALEQADRSEEIEVGLRVFVGQRSAIVSSSDARASTLSEIAERAVSMAKEAPEDPHAGLADPSQLAQDTDVSRLDLFDASEEPTAEELKDLSLRAEAAALENSGISQMESAGAGYGKRRVHLAASNGFSAGTARTDIGISCVTISGEGTAMERDYDYDSRIYRSDMRSPEDIGRIAAERTVARIGARKPQTGTFPVLFDERIASSLIGHLIQTVNGAAIARGSGWLRDKLGEQVLPSALSIVEDPHRIRTSGSKLYDAEGLPTASRAIVQDGVLTGWTLDLSNARKLGMASTASAARGASSGPSPSTTNIALTQGTKSKEDLLADMGTGLLVTSMIGSTINPNTGDYSRGASGFWVENGEIQYAVNECTVAGNLREMLMRIIPANDARTHLSTVVPSLLVEGLTLAGE